MDGIRNIDIRTLDNDRVPGRCIKDRTGQSGSGAGKPPDPTMTSAAAAGTAGNKLSTSANKSPIRSQRRDSRASEGEVELFMTNLLLPRAQARMVRRRVRWRVIVPAWRAVKRSMLPAVLRRATGSQANSKRSGDLHPGKMNLLEGVKAVRPFVEVARCDIGWAQVLAQAQADRGQVAAEERTLRWVKIGLCHTRIFAF